MELIQLHERTWGMDTYPGRPSLHDLLNRSVVVFWSGDDKAGNRRSIATVHDSVDDLNDVILAMILANKVTAHPNRRLQRIFVDQKPAEIVGLKLILSDRLKPGK
jgi:hypothetical protein